MSLARKHQINLKNTPYYHCISRCVRQAFLCGEDQYSGKNFDHRKKWMVDRLSLLAATFAIDVCAFSIMSTHYHLILKINATKASKWTSDEVIQRWTQLFKGDLITQLYIKGAALTESETQYLQKKADIWREQLTSISWFMRCLNQTIAQMANQEDGCKGRFWHGRFTSQALLDEQALLAAMVYVELNPIRAGICDNLENSEFTSFVQRLREYTQPECNSANSSCSGDMKSVNPQAELSHTKTAQYTSTTQSFKSSFKVPTSNQAIVPLIPFIGGNQNQEGISYRLEDYFELVDWTGRAIRPDKKGYIPQSEPKIIRKLGIDADSWLDTVNHFSDHFYLFIGPKEIMANICKSLGKKWLTGINPCRQLFNHLNPLSP